MKGILKRLCTPVCVSGDEMSLAKQILSEVSPYCESAEIDKAGNVICTKKGKTTPKSKIMLAAHLDEVGFIITNITDDGLLKFASVGGIDARIWPAKKVVINCSEQIYGVIGIVPTHMLSGDSKNAVLGEDELYIDIGAENKKEAEALVSLGDMGTLCGEYREFGENGILARALDDRAGCAILISLLKGEVPCDITVCFTVQEEVGCRGAQMVTEQVKPDIAVVLDSTTACDLDGVPDEKSVCNLSLGGVVSFMDRGCIYDRELYKIIIETAKEKGIPAQSKRAVTGANDSSTIHKTAGGVRTAAISLPCRYLHTPGCVINFTDLEATKNLALAVLEPFSKL